MLENYEYVTRGFRILLPAMSGYIGQLMNYTYRDNWWEEVRSVMNDPRDLPYSGTYDQLIDSLDIACCLRILQRKWQDVFRSYLQMNCQTYARELMGVRNVVAHIGSEDLDQHMAERALDTMTLLCREIDPESAEEIHKLYQEIREKTVDGKIVIEYTGLAQPETDSVRGALKEGSLLNINDENLVQKTTLTRKITYGGKTVVYPVYKIRLDLLFYNDQNDRIATWISQYESENEEGALSELSKDVYNRIIENFIVESNPDSIRKTQTNIANYGQREPGVTLADGRIVDGNRRFSCLRRIQRESSEPLYFESVIMDMDINDDSKEIKRLELAIQHGEEKKVDYDQIDYAIGTYRDVEQNKLLTVEEYAESTNEKPSDVKNRINIAKRIVEFLDYAGLPGQYHIAREYQVYSLFREMAGVGRKLSDEEKETLKIIAFNNTVTKAIPDQRKFIRDIKELISGGNYTEFFKEQKELGKNIQEELSNNTMQNKQDLERFAEDHADTANGIRESMERAMLKNRSQQLKAKPSETVSKCIASMQGVDPRLFERLDEEEKEKLKVELDDLAKIISRFKRVLSK